MGWLMVEDFSKYRKRLDFYKNLQKKPGNQKCEAILKWIHIYSERLHQLEKKQATLGLKVQLNTESTQATLTQVC
jgi:hypothetical protein